jgi:4-phytase/acid phosphatase
MRSIAFPLIFLLCSAGAAGQPSPRPATPSDLRLVVIVSRHGIRSPTDPNELSPYAAHPWPAWEVAPGFLTPHGATMMRYFGASYRSMYAAAGLFPITGCPAANALYVWADVDERTLATASALLDGLAPTCGFTTKHSGEAVDPLFHALPSLGRGDPATASDSLQGSIGADPQSIVAAYGLAFAKLDAILGCADGECRKVSGVATTLLPNAKTGLFSVEGAVDNASTAVEDFILAYADGKPVSDVGWGAVDSKTLLELSQLHTLKALLTSETPYAARVQGSNLLTHVLATIDQGATGIRNEKARAPLAAHFVAFVGHDSNLEALAGMLRLRWLMPGYQLNDTPPGGALVFEVHQSSPSAEPVVRVFFTAQSLDQMRTLSKDPPNRVPVFVPGCATLDCPLTTFDRIANAAIDPAFIGRW